MLVLWSLTSLISILMNLSFKERFADERNYEMPLNQKTEKVFESGIDIGLSKISSTQTELFKNVISV